MTVRMWDRLPAFDNPFLTIRTDRWSIAHLFAGKEAPNVGRSTIADQFGVSGSRDGCRHGAGIAGRDQVRAHLRLRPGGVAGFKCRNDFAVVDATPLQV